MARSSRRRDTGPAAPRHAPFGEPGRLPWRHRQLLEAERAGVVGERVVAQVPVQEQVMHFPELVLLPGAVCGQGSRQGTLMNPGERKLLVDEANVGGMLGEYLLHLRLGGATERTLEVAPLHERHPGVGGPAHGRPADRDRHVTAASADDGRRVVLGLADEVRVAIGPRARVPASPGRSARFSRLVATNQESSARSWTYPSRPTSNPPAAKGNIPNTPSPPKRVHPTLSPPPR